MKRREREKEGTLVHCDWVANIKKWEHVACCYGYEGRVLSQVTHQAQNVYMS